jgi:hypothetical protein
MIADQRNARRANRQAGFDRTIRGDSRQARACGSVLGESADREIFAQPGELHFAPCDAAQIARDQAQYSAALTQFVQNFRHARTNELPQI